MVAAPGLKGPSRPEYPRRMSANARDAATAVVRDLRDAGHVAYFAGGCVRDELLGHPPNDYDVATDATPGRLTEIFKHTRQVGAHFGVIHVHRLGHVIETATFRADAAYSDKRRPDAVRFSDAREDAVRRDFTVNALFLDPLDNGPSPPRSPAGGRVIDFVGGMDDLARHVLRAVGNPDQRLAEDHLRALRAVRLASKLAFTIDAPTAAAIVRHATELAGVSRERIGDEVRLMLAHASRARAVRLLHDLRLDGPVLQEACLGEHELRYLTDLDPTAPVPLALAAWALDRGHAPERPADQLVHRWRAALCLSNQEDAAVRSYLTLLAELHSQWSAGEVAKQKRMAAAHGFHGALHLLRTRDSALAHEVSERRDRLAATASGLHPPPLLGGDELIRAGLRPGPRFKELLELVYDAQLEDRIANREEAVRLAKELAGGTGV